MYFLCKRFIFLLQQICHAMGIVATQLRFVWVYWNGGCGKYNENENGDENDPIRSQK